MNIIMRTCGWCETIHPENLSIDWFPDRLYFCTDMCLREFGETTANLPKRKDAP